MAPNPKLKLCTTFYSSRLTLLVLSNIVSTSNYISSYFHNDENWGNHMHVLNFIGEYTYFIVQFRFR